ncbi:VOC family protein [Segetibacter koreensis]|uniref:VOC family protein n=1 Tax=Segetibacter koreensis TaxID=398037 RepID=UPI000372B497|nr:VOC family protein [Segetibacter koreensis]
MSNRVVHFEIPCDDPDKTMEFFKEVFGWGFQSYGQEQYWLATTGDDKSPGINGAIMKKRDPKQPLVNTLSVTNIDESIQKIEKAGGKIVMPKMAVPSMGWVVYFTDPDGNIHGAWQDDKDAK